MHRIDGATAAAALPAAAAVSGTPGYFTSGNPSTATPPTVPTQDWCNTMQEELASVVEWAGLTLDKANHGQLLAALQAKFVLAAGGGAGSLLAVNGWRRYSDGFIEQWGYVPASLTSEGTASITFPIAFPTACFGVYGHIVNSGSSVSGNTIVQEVSLSLTGAVLMIQDQNSGFSDATGGFRWFSRGH